MEFCIICQKILEGRRGKKTCSVACRMAKSRGRGVKLSYEPVKRGESKYKGNCVPTAIAHATGRAFMWVEAELLAMDPRHKKGYKRKHYAPLLERLGFTEVPEACGKLLDDMVVESGCWYLACTRDHMVAVRDGVYKDVADQLKKRRRRLRELWKCNTKP